MFSPCALVSEIEKVIRAISYLHGKQDMPNKQSLKEIDTLVQLSSTINSSLDIAEVLKSTMRFVEDLMDAEVSSIFEVDDANSELFFRVVRGEGAYKAKEIRMKMGEGVV